MLSMPALDRAFNQVRQELCDVGLLADGIYLDRIDLVGALMPAATTLGYAYDNGTGFWSRLLGFREGTIYIPVNASLHSLR